MLDISGGEEVVVALLLPIGSLKTCSGLEPVPRCDPSGLVTLIVSDICFHIYIQRRFKHAVLDTHLSCLSCLSRRAS